MFKYYNKRKVKKSDSTYRGGAELDPTFNYTTYTL